MCAGLTGAVADILLEPYLAIVLGLVGGVVSTLGFIFLPDWVTFSLRFRNILCHHVITLSSRIHDTCAVHSLHLIPGALGGLASVLYALFLSKHK